jgi:uncharacterized protein with ParB-like and HNH nuclease domain
MDNISEAKLEPLLVGNITGNFLIPSYQRGYRWIDDHILKLLNDIKENGDQNYCLQPIVVKRVDENKFELIDGQQRLTTLFLIFKNMKQILPSTEVKFSLEFETRLRSKEYLNELDEKLAVENIDFYHIYNASKCISGWFDDANTGDKTLKTINLYRYFAEKVKVIWYEVDTHENSSDLFTRLNIGKIPLTNAELVKALFLSKDNNEINEEKQIEIATGWDIIEKELHNKNFWAFLTNESAEKYATRIELLFNLIADKKPDEREIFYTFYYFSDRMKSESKKAIWLRIQKYFLLLKEWFENRNIYHKVGYLIATGEKLQDLIMNSEKKTKSVFESELNAKITNSLDLDKDKILELSYTNKTDRIKIEKLLLLFNIETVRLLKNTTERYSFESHKNNWWSLEHIHAQLSEGLNKKEEQQEWLRLHKDSLVELRKNSDHESVISEIIEKIDLNINDISREIFDNIFSDVIKVLSIENENKDYLHLVSNLALLKTTNNSAINNSTFDVKRNRILEMDRNGEYIPICTRRVFLKYYTFSKDHQLHFWGEQDRKAYMEAMIGDEGLILKYLK